MSGRYMRSPQHRGPFVQSEGPLVSKDGFNFILCVRVCFLTAIEFCGPYYRYYTVGLAKSYLILIGLRYIYINVNFSIPICLRMRCGTYNRKVSLPNIISLKWGRDTYNRRVWYV